MAPSPPEPHRASSRRRAAIGGCLASLVLCGPAVVLYGGFIVLPAILGFGYSLTDWTGWTRRARFIGLENFRELFRDELFFNAISFTLYETLLIVVFFSFGAMMLAVLLDRLRVMKGLIRALFFYPYVLSILVSGLLFQYLTNYREGAINSLLDGAGLGAWKIEWMTKGLAPYYVFALVAWSGLGFFTTLYLANLQTIPTELYEAAAIDGAGPLSVFKNIQFPLLIPTLTTNSVLALITGINLFPQIVVTTQGGPGYHTTDTIGYYIYYLGIEANRQGYASAVSFVTFAGLVVLAVIQVAVLRRRTVAL